MQFQQLTCDKIQQIGTGGQVGHGMPLLAGGYRVHMIRVQQRMLEQAALPLPLRSASEYWRDK